LNIQTTLKRAIRKAMDREKLGRHAFAVRLGVADQEVTRILDEGHNTRLERLEQAAAELGLTIRVEVT